MLFGWAVLIAYHELRVSCDAAMDGLTDHQNHQALADELSERHTWAQHEIINRLVPFASKTIMTPEANERIKGWRASVLEILARYKCKRQEVDHFDAMNVYDMGEFGGLPSELAIACVRVKRLGEIAKSHAVKAESLKLSPRV
jgi:hypothetical protein